MIDKKIDKFNKNSKVQVPKNQQSAINKAENNNKFSIVLMREKNLFTKQRKVKLSQ